MTPAFLPPASLVPVQTRRLAQPQVLWRHAASSVTGFDADQIYCCPQTYEAGELYTSETRIEWADRYGGAGTGAAGGSGRCAALNGLQTKGVGVTPLVAPQADAFHSSGTMMLFEAATEALFAAVYQECLPFGAVPVHAVVLTGGRFTRALGTDAQARCVRALAVRSFVARPAHFMRNTLAPAGRLAAGDEAPGHTADAWRTAQAMSHLAANFKACLALKEDEHDEVALLDAGLRELARRLAWQCAAGFSKRLPHGTLSCSNMALDGAYLDFGVSNFSPAYRRLCWAHGQEPWTESFWPVRTLMQLREQLDKYRPSISGSGIITAEDLALAYDQHFRQRLAVEMVKMAGLTEDMASACPPELAQAWLASMRGIWMRGANERFVTDPGHFPDGRHAPPPRATGRYDLNQVLAAAGPCHDARRMDMALQPLLDDPALRASFVTTATRVRHWLHGWVGEAAAVGVDAYLGRQAVRKNALIPSLQRHKAAGLDTLKPFRDLEVHGDTAAIAPAINQALAEARHVLADLDPGLPGATGLCQLLATTSSATSLLHPHPAIETTP